MPSKNSDLRAQNRLILVFFLCCLLPALGLFAQIPGNLPIELDPNDPQADRKTRLERHEAIIHQQIAERKKKIEEMRLAREKAEKESQQAPTTPGAVPPSAPAAAPTPAPAKKTRGLDTPQVTFFVSPASLILRLGEQVATETGLLNPKSTLIDRVEVALDFPAGALRPIAIHDAAIRPLLSGEPETFLDLKQGRFVYRGELTSPTMALTVPLVTIEWQAVAPISGAQIATAFPGERSGAYLGARYLSEGTLGESQLGAALTITGEQTGGLLMVDSLAPVAAAHVPDPPRIWINQPQQGRLFPGDWLVIDVGLNNPGFTPFDEIRLAGRFDPEAVEIIDTDRENLMDRGRNVLDGPFRSVWPWDMLYLNSVDQERGIFYYRKGSQEGITLNDPETPMIRIFARIKQPTDAPIIQWIWQSDAAAHVPQTGVYHFNRNLYDRRNGEETGPALRGLISRIDGYERADPNAYRF